MVRVYNCHHFIKQTVLGTDTEPHSLWCDEDKLVIATEDSTVIVYNQINEEPYKQIAQLPTLGKVIKVVHSAKDNYIATLEYRVKGEEEDPCVRVYFGWDDAGNDKPLSIGIAGHMTSIRHEQHAMSNPCFSSKSMPSHLHVVEIPLKGTPSNLTVEKSTGYLAVIVQDHVLVYGLCCKSVAGSDQVYQDLKCILDLEFVFQITDIVVCEDFIMCSSPTKCQVARLNLDGRNNVKKCLKIQQGTKQDSDDENIKQKPSSNHNNMNELIKWLNLEDNCDENKMYIVDDVNLTSVNLNTNNDSESTSTSSKPNGPKKVELRSIREYNSAAKGSDRTKPKYKRVILGPKPQRHMPRVTVEFEDSCGCGDDTLGLVDKGTTTYLYSTMDKTASHYYINPVLIPVLKYKYDKDNSASSDDLAGMFCLINTSKEGLLYDLMAEGGATLIATYPYTTSIKQVCVEGNLLYAMSSTGVEIYSLHCVARVMHRLESYNEMKTLPSATVESCLLGLQPFMSLASMSHTATQLVLLSKQLGKGGDENSWSLYILQKPSVEELHQDMIELAVGGVEDNLAVYNHLLEEDHLLLTAHQYCHGNSDNIQELIRESAFRLAFCHLMQSKNKNDMSVPYMIMSGRNPGSILEAYHKQFSQMEGNEESSRAGVITRYLDVVLLHNRIYTISEDLEPVLSWYQSWSPHKLPLIVLTCTPQVIQSHTDLIYKMLTMYKDHKNTRVKSLYSLGQCYSYLYQGETEQATRILLEIDETHLETMISLLADCLIEDSKELSLLGKVLVVHCKDILLKSLVTLCQKDVIQCDSVAAVLKIEDIGVLEDFLSLQDIGVS